MIKGGKGGNKTLTGLKFETRTDLKTKFSELPNYRVEGDDLLFKERKVASLLKKNDLYKKFLTPRGVR